ncbi:MAG: mechanosensitive ion channel family protein [Paracoccaceae bacterium]
MSIRLSGRLYLFAFAVFYCLAHLIVTPSHVMAQETVVEEAIDEGDEIYIAPVILDGELLFELRGSTALPAVERAEKVVERLIATAEMSEVLSVDVEVMVSEFGRNINVDGRMVSVTSQADAEHEQVEIDVLAHLQAEAIEEAIVAYRLGRSHDARVNSALAALGWTAAFLVLSFVFFRKRTAFVRGITRLAERRTANVEEATKSFVRSKAIAAILGYLLNLTLWAAYFISLYYYLSLVLLSFTETRAFAEILLRYVSNPLIAVLDGAIGYIPNLITLGIIAMLMRMAIQGIKIFFDNVESGAFELQRFEKHWIAPTYFLSRITVIMIALVFAYPYIPGADSAAFQGLTILAGVMVSLGSNTVVSNMMAGLFVIYRRSTNVGDRIQVGDISGDVVEIKMMETIIKSIKNELISIPNSELLNSKVTNFTRHVDGNGILVHTTVGIGYEEPPKKIEAMLIEAVRRTRSLKKDPKPFVLWSKLADYAINYEVNAFTTRGASLPRIRSDLHRHIVDVFNENETQIMTPSYIADPDIPKIPEKEWDGTLAHLEDQEKSG